MGSNSKGDWEFQKENQECGVLGATWEVSGEAGRDQVCPALLTAKVTGGRGITGFGEVAVTVTLTQRASKGREIGMEWIQEKARDVEAGIGVHTAPLEGFARKGTEKQG